jgi:hypothetical protein
MTIALPCCTAARIHNGIPTLVSLYHMVCFPLLTPTHRCAPSPPCLCMRSTSGSQLAAAQGRTFDAVITALSANSTVRVIQDYSPDITAAAAAVQSNVCWALLVALAQPTGDRSDTQRGYQLSFCLDAVALLATCVCVVGSNRCLKAPFSGTAPSTVTG